MSAHSFAVGDIVRLVTLDEARAFLKVEHDGASGEFFVGELGEDPERAHEYYLTERMCEVFAGKLFVVRGVCESTGSISLALQADDDEYMAKKVADTGFEAWMLRPYNVESDGEPDGWHDFTLEQAKAYVKELREEHGRSRPWTGAFRCLEQMVEEADRLRGVLTAIKAKCLEPGDPINSDLQNYDKCVGVLNEIYETIEKELS